AARVVPALALVAAFGSFWPSQIRSISRSADAVLAPYRAVEAAAIHHAIVFWHGFPARRSDVTEPPLPGPDLDDDILYARDRRDNDLLAAAFPDRKLYVIRYEHGEPVVKPWEPPPAPSLP